MNDLLGKLSSYNLFNYLFCGAVFAFLSTKLTSLPLLQDDLLTGIFLYYFMGLVISRLGSLILEPVLKKISFVKFANYSDFVAASKIDSKVDILSEENNMYRTLSSLFLALILLKIYETFKFNLAFLQPNDGYVIIVILLTLFLFSYRKQTGYITKRINSHKPK